MSEADEQTQDPGGQEEEQSDEPEFGQRKINDPLAVDPDAPKQSWQPETG